MVGTFEMGLIEWEVFGHAGIGGQTKGQARISPGGGEGGGQLEIVKKMLL